MIEFLVSASAIRHEGGIPAQCAARQHADERIRGQGQQRVEQDGNERRVAAAGSRGGDIDRHPQHPEQRQRQARAGQHCGQGAGQDHVAPQRPAGQADRTAHFDKLPIPGTHALPAAQHGPQQCRRGRTPQADPQRRPQFARAGGRDRS
ncbi:hypothetical protein G6F40_015273 [Rhizopus arrhizus]|nr:hypothetical protein G6F40_015273 [Rhizopus arrhizus]